MDVQGIFDFKEYKFFLVTLSAVWKVIYAAPEHVRSSLTC